VAVQEELWSETLSEDSFLREEEDRYASAGNSTAITCVTKSTWELLPYYSRMVTAALRSAMAV